MEHVLVLNAADDADTFNLRYVFPPDYQYQVPILLEILEDSTANILHYQIEDDVNEPNKVVNFTIGNMAKDESVLIHFSCWVLVKNHEYVDLSEYVKFPKKDELPEETKIWLSSTEVVQANSFLIMYKANQLKGDSDNLINFTSVIAPFIKEHRYLLFVLQLNLGIFFSQDAITTLLINGENVGRSHLACALLRSNNVPARVLLANNDQGFWTQMHYMLEYYCPGYGWILIDPTKGTTPYEPKRQVINRVCYPVDEDNTKTDYIFSLMKGEERWMWIDNENVYPYYVDCNEGSKSKMFSENEVTTDSFTADYTFLLTQLVFHQYEQCLGG
ncbi:MAG: transglutaminase domain-containing protein, partial [Thermoplasmatales archaeon]|nr:transglutaminase domain-containing protein [Thermoplasmatales archaeon]